MASQLLALLIPFLGLVNSAILPRDGDVAVDNKWLDHDKIVPIPASLDGGIKGDLEDRFSPLLHPLAGCTPYAAVDANGYVGAGLQATGDADGHCRDANHAGQTYTRVGKSHDRFAILYSYYVPKVMEGDAGKHRHHWLAAVVWLAFDGCPDEARNFSPRGISFSTSPGKFDTKPTTTLYVSKDGIGPATHPIISYVVDELPYASYHLGSKDALSPPLIGWDALPQPAKDQLNGIKYEATQVPFSDANFQAYLDAAYNETIYEGVSTETNCQSVNLP
ncbi:NPP1-domain-containing protein [Colletotrichum zoysiae]|uniref:NPP1-domain-containing protein n=1 Tax=Colletotrichum zoysiae TaxID=1216348 RepID=A0AAD9HL15_9PEZI|nr:NPP1-domain-containing protein [Colletotrichum zoysiae]